MNSAYFDNQNTSCLLPEVVSAMAPFWTGLHASPSSLHTGGVMARDAVDQARHQFASFINASQADIYFTSGATESANLAIKGVAWANRKVGNHIVSSSIEHPSVQRSLEFLEREGFSVTKVPVDKFGLLNPKDLMDSIREDTVLVCLHHANHDIGTIQSVQELIEVGDQAGIPTFVDASTSGGWLDIDVKKWGASLVSLAPHRFHGPLGAGVLYFNGKTRIQSLIHGGNQENGLRAGTENVAAIVGAGVAAEMAAKTRQSNQTNLTQIQTWLWQGIKEAISEVVLHGPEVGEKRLWTNLSFSLAGLDGEGLVLMSDIQRIALATGSSCISKSLKGSPVLDAIDVPRSLAQGNVIITLGSNSRKDEVDYFLSKFPGIVTKLRSMSPHW